MKKLTILILLLFVMGCAEENTRLHPPKDCFVELVKDGMQGYEIKDRFGRDAKYNMVRCEIVIKFLLEHSGLVLSNLVVEERWEDNWNQKGKVIIHEEKVFLYEDSNFPWVKSLMKEGKIPYPPKKKI
jgi:hypothetical protein